MTATNHSLRFWHRCWPRWAAFFRRPRKRPMSRMAEPWQRHAVPAATPSALRTSAQNPKPPFRTFKERWPIESLAESLAEGIVTGHPAMPEFVFKEDEIADFLAYLATL